MTATFSPEQLHSVLAQSEPSTKLAGALSGPPLTVCTDSRQACDKTVYLALKGERFDGHSFVAAAIDAGAPGAIINQSAEASVLESLGDRQCFLLIVPDTLRAYQNLATSYRLRVNPTVVAVTGSSGKTTTKEMCAAVFSGRRFFKSAQNENNEIGVPKTILAMPEDTQILILEMGMRGLGQIAELAACGRPDIGIITCVGVAHIELLGSRENIARAKCELLEHLNPANPGREAILGQAEALLVDRAAAVFTGKTHIFPADTFKVVSADAQSETFVFGQEHSQNQYTVYAHGTFLLQDAWCAVQAGLSAGLSPAEVAAGLSTWRAVEGRGNAVGTRSGALLVDESYNSNPDSVRCAVEAICSGEAFPQPSKIVVLGEMLELGDFSDRLHEELGHWLKDKPISMLMTVGSQAGLIASGASGAAFEILPLKDREEAQAKLRQLMQKDCCVMVKGSHGTKLYELVGALLE
ncbi:MAG: UDP-N-acetylmuramoyl-tripeptide--D-alanyl-D-alanine ligase [Cyanobacteria bacterium SZAS LIN-2]|nr:UDP-N-acetylmuramoyl-tripeptide--D-alanyl-D-alanine ligase [Cyanobacteria bacterium SZAS LIN-2]